MAKPLAQSGSHRALTLFGRAVSLHCPLCGSDRIFASWFVMKDRCPKCRLLFGRGEPGHEVVAAILNLTIPFLLWIVCYTVILIWTWPDPTWTSVVLMIGLPLAHYPIAQALAVALRLWFAPTPGARLAGRRRRDR
jgi:uncharacterized protein (DUF983 family)